jgi:hypothetical protein
LLQCFSTWFFFVFVLFMIFSPTQLFFSSWNIGSIIRLVSITFLALVHNYNTIKYICFISSRQRASMPSGVKRYVLPSFAICINISAGNQSLIVLANVQWLCGLILYAVRIFDSYFPTLSLGKQGRGSNPRLLRERGTRDGCQLSNNLQAHIGIKRAIIFLTWQ